MAIIKYDPRNVQVGYHHNWSMIPQQTSDNSLEGKAHYGLRPVIPAGNQDYSEGSKSKYSEQMPNLSNDYFG